VPNCIERHKQLAADFWKRFSHYAANELTPGCINVDLVQQCIAKLKKGKAPGLDGHYGRTYFIGSPNYSSAFIIIV